MKRLREVAKEMQKACKDPSQARKAAERKAGGMRDATQRGVRINPGAITMLLNLTVNLAELGNQSGVLS